MIGGKGFIVKKVDGQGWMVAKGGEKLETDNPADHYNTVLKMAKKRALVDAVLTTTAASDIFAQDLEDLNASLATLTPQAPAQPTPNQSAPPPVPAPAHTTPSKAVATTVQSDAVAFRQTQIHFGKNRGMTLADLTPQQLHWYEAEWMPKKEKQTARAGTATAPSSPDSRHTASGARPRRRRRLPRPAGRGADAPRRQCPPKWQPSRQENIWR